MRKILAPLVGEVNGFDSQRQLDPRGRNLSDKARTSRVPREGRVAFGFGFGLEHRDGALGQRTATGAVVLPPLKPAGSPPTALSLARQELETLFGPAPEFLRRVSQ